MARADLLVTLAKAASRGEGDLVRRTVEALAAEERAKQHHVLADRLMENVAAHPGNSGCTTPRTSAVSHLVWESAPNRALGDLELSATLRTACDELLEEQRRADLLRSYGLEPRHRVLLAGPPGCGKTSIAEALAYELMLPLFSIRYEGVIGSYLGETASRLEKVFEHTRSRQCVLFFDEFDTLGKERGDTNETGEIKRVVSSLLLQVDALPSYVIVVAATNHPELLDRAVWRRFQLRLEVPPPTYKQRLSWFRRLEAQAPLSLRFPAASFARATAGSSFAEIEDLGADLVRRTILAGPGADSAVIAQERLQQWKARFKPVLVEAE